MGNATHSTFGSCATVLVSSAIATCMVVSVSSSPGRLILRVRRTSQQPRQWSQGILRGSQVGLPFLASTWALRQRPMKQHSRLSTNRSFRHRTGRGVLLLGTPL